MTNTDEHAKAFLARLIRLEEERRANAEDRRELGAEMKSADLLKEEIAGIKLAVKRHFEEPDKRKLRESAEEFADALGEFRDTPLGDAAVQRAVQRAAASPVVQRAARKFVETAKRSGGATISTVGMEPVTIKAGE